MTITTSDQPKKALSLKSRALIAVSALSLYTSVSYAELDTSASGAFTKVLALIADVAAAAWPVIAAGIVAVVTVKLVKRFSRFV